MTKRDDRKMIKTRVPIFTSEYHLTVVMGDHESLAKYVAANAEGWDYKKALKQVRKCSGCAWNTLPDKNLFITIDGCLSLDDALATISHEAVHAGLFLTEHLGIDDKTGEFVAHCVSAIFRGALKSILNGRTLTIATKP